MIMNLKSFKFNISDIEIISFDIDRLDSFSLYTSIEVLLLFVRHSLVILVVHQPRVHRLYFVDMLELVRRIRQWILNEWIINRMIWLCSLNIREWLWISMVEVWIPMLVFFNILRRKIISNKLINVFVFDQSAILNKKSPFPLDTFDDRIHLWYVRYFPGNLYYRAKREEKKRKALLNYHFVQKRKSMFFNKENVIGF